MNVLKSHAFSHLRRINRRFSRLSVVDCSVVSYAYFEVLKTRESYYFG